MSPIYLLSKQAMDRTLAVIALLIFAPAFVVVALLVKSTSPGPVLFRQ